MSSLRERGKEIVFNLKSVADNLRQIRTISDPGFTHALPNLSISRYKQPKIWRFMYAIQADVIFSFVDHEKFYKKLITNQKESITKTR